MDKRGTSHTSLLAAGFTQVPNTVLCDSRLSHAAIRVYALLLKYAWQSGSAFPGQKTLAGMIGTDARRVRAHLSELERAGYIQISRRGGTRTNVYTMLDPAESSSAGERPETSGQERTKVSSPDRTKRAAHERTKTSPKEDSKRIDTEEINAEKKDGPLDRPSASGEDEPTDELLTLMKASPTALDRRIFRTMIDAHPETDAELVALDFLRYQEIQELAKARGQQHGRIYPDKVKGWCLAMQSASMKGMFRRSDRYQEDQLQDDEVCIVPSGDTTFDDFRQAILDRVRPAVYQEWFGILELIGNNGRDLVLRAPSEYHRDWINLRLGGILREALQTIGRSDLTVIVHGPEE